MEGHYVIVQQITTFFFNVSLSLSLSFVHFVCVSEVYTHCVWFANATCPKWSPQPMLIGYRQLQLSYRWPQDWALASCTASASQSHQGSENHKENHKENDRRMIGSSLGSYLLVFSSLLVSFSFFLLPRFAVASSKNFTDGITHSVTASVAHRRRLGRWANKEMDKDK